ncbi:hypothetical protein CRM22_003794 [Opisthorchis felineus]|uniref:Uncharacterized protein n=1 Tax=Opisthorchis felineus TaxID=147828 RepID=A0A4S2LZJ3_OPIFE|nr:hypothetical protein CRM22_003794 [Opisthorchis felineus]
MSDTQYKPIIHCYFVASKCDTFADKLCVPIIITCLVPYPFEMKQLLIVPCIVLCCTTTVTANGHAERLPKREFDECVKKCGRQFENCTKEMHNLWLNFAKNRKTIMKKLSSCCLDGEHDHDAPPTLSFATCVREKCRAEMWGRRLGDLIPGTSNPSVLPET